MGGGVMIWKIFSSLGVLHCNALKDFWLEISLDENAPELVASNNRSTVE